MATETIKILSKKLLQATLQYSTPGKPCQNPYTLFRGYNTVPLDIWEQIKATNANSWDHWNQYLKEPYSE